MEISDVLSNDVSAWLYLPLRRQSFDYDNRPPEAHRIEAWRPNDGEDLT
jgi:hypothetical protein